MDKNPDSWIHNFTINDITRHKKGFTVYKITSIVFPRLIPEALSSITVCKRFSEVKKLHKEIYKKHKELHMKGIVPQLPTESNYFKRFEQNVIEERKRYILDLLNFISEHSTLYKSQIFIEFFDASYSLTPNDSPKHNKTDDILKDLPKGNISSICTDLKIKEQPEIELIDATRDADSEHILQESTSAAIESGSMAKPMQLTETVAAVLEKTEQNDLTIDYLYEAAYDFSQAVQNEVNCNYFKAFEFYKSGIDRLLNGAKNDHNKDRQGIAKIKVCQYLTRAESIYEKYIFNNLENKLFPIGILEANAIVKDLEKPIHFLSRYKVLKIIHNVMQVQDVTDKKCYIMKAIEKPPKNSSCINLSQNISHMIPLIAFFQTENNIYLLLKHESGGRLWDYIISYDTYPTDCKHLIQSLENIFLSIDRPLQTNSNKSSPIIKPKIPVEIKTPTDSHTFTITSVDNLRPLESKIPDFNTLSMDMNINELINCGQKLIQSVSSTLERAQINEDDKLKNDMPSGIENINTIMNIHTLKDICLEITNSASAAVMEEPATINNPMSKCSGGNVLLPEGIVRQWAAELIIAIKNLHSNGIICGDLNIRNLLLGCRGQLLITYFYKKNYNSLNSLSNYAVNNLYVAPERPLTYISDWWSVGIIIFELLTKTTFLSCHPSGILSYYQIQYPANISLSEHAADLLDNLLIINPEQRLGQDITEIEKHPFFSTIDWESLKKSGKYDLIV